MAKEKTHAKKIHHIKKQEKDEKNTILKEKNFKVFKKIFWNEKALIVILLLIAIGLSTYFRMYPASLPVTHQWAEDSYYNQIKAGISQQISQQYPHLPTAQKEIEVNKQFQQYLKEHQSELEPKIEKTAEYFKSRMQNDDNQTYLLAIDPYFYLRQTEHYEARGQAGTTYVGGNQPVSEAIKLMYPDVNFKEKVDWDGQRMAPVGATAILNAHTVVISIVDKIFKFFGSKKGLMRSAFYVPVIISALAIIFAFFLGKRIAGIIGGFVSAVMLAIQPSFLNRTIAGFTDTDPYNVLFPLAIVWAIVEAFNKEKTKDKIIWASIAGAITGIFALFWMWWFIFAIILAGIGIYILILIIRSLMKDKDIKKLVKDKKLLNEIWTGITYFVSTGILVSLFKGFNTFFNGLFAPLHATQLKTVGLSVWPNILTTVAELNSASIQSSISAMGGVLLFTIAMIGIIITIAKINEKKDFGIKAGLVLLIWTGVALYASTKGVRFNLLLAPVFAVAFGVFAGKAYQLATKWLKEEKQWIRLGTQILILLVVALLLIQPIKVARSTALHEVPSMNDAWYNTLTKIKTESQPNAIINSWWDFGHWFITIANRSATFDGAGQDRHMAYWIGRSLTSNNPELTRGILRMVDCGNNDAFYQLNKYLNNSDKSIKILNDIVIQNKSSARKELEKYGLNEEESSKVLQYTHCQAPEDYYITSDDMIGKAGVWAHFGNWNFTKSTIYYIAKHYNEAEGINKIVKDLGLSEEKASELYYEANSLATNRDVDTWMSPWPNYVTQSARPCTEINQTIYCKIDRTIANQGNIRTIISETRTPVNEPNKTKILLATVDGAGTILKTQEVIPSEVSIGTKDGWNTTEIENNSFPYGLSIAKIDNQTIKAIMANDLISDSSFTKLFFFDGIGMPNFKKFSEERSFTGGTIIVYKVNVNEK